MEIYDYYTLKLTYPVQKNCHEFQRSNILLLIIWDIMLNNGSPDPLIVTKLGPETLGSLTSFNSQKGIT